MPRPVVAYPRRRQKSSWEELLPQFIFQAGMAKIRQNFAKEEAAKDRELRKDIHEQRKDMFETQMEMNLAKGFQTTPIMEKTKPSTRKDIPEGAKQVVEKQKRPDFHWRGKDYWLRQPDEIRPISMNIKGQEVLVNPRTGAFQMAGEKDKDYKPDLFEYMSGPHKGKQFYLPPGTKDVPPNAKRVSTASTKIDIHRGKILPAEQAGKLGEFKAYTDTMREIEAMVRGGKINTGPFEFLWHKADNWGILPNRERIELRSLVARLPGLMYAMRGKQLSDKELEVALKMMPQMNMDEVPFGIALKKFNEYMKTVLEGKTEAFGAAGYSVEKFGHSPAGKPPLSSFHGGG